MNSLMSVFSERNLASELVQGVHARRQRAKSSTVGAALLVLSLFVGAFSCSADPRNFNVQGADGNAVAAGHAGKGSTSAAGSASGFFGGGGAGGQGSGAFSGNSANGDPGGPSGTDPGGGAAMACQPGSAKCDPTGRLLLTCSSAGQWQSTQCGFICTGQACAGGCVPGTRQCAGAEPQRCSDEGAWVNDGAACAAECKEGACAGSCKTGSTQCVSSTQVQTCSDGQWGAKSPCSFACVDNACSGICAPDDTRCATGTALQRCTALGQWGTQSSCDFVCNGKTCGGHCKPGNKQCASNIELQTCGDNGEWSSPTSCQNACVNNLCGGVCRPGSKRCGSAAGMLETCNNSGAWVSSSCPGSCVNNSCATCTPGATECTSTTTVRTCGNNGEWQQATNCQFACVGKACGGSCKPNSKECVNGAEPQYRTCGSTGEWSAAVACAPSPACVNGGCGTDPKIAFVTSTLYTGNLGGLAGADQKCNERAKAGSQPGTYKAWLSDDTQSPSTRFSLQGGPIRLADGSELAKNWAELLANGVTRVFNVTEIGTRPPKAVASPGSTTAGCGDETVNALVWSDTRPNGLRLTVDRNCANWTTVTNNKLNMGRWDDQKYWSSYCTRNDAKDIDNSCESKAALYCFQQ